MHSPTYNRSLECGYDSYMSNEDTLHSCNLEKIARDSTWFMEALHAAHSLNFTSWCIGAGAVRNLVWDHLHGYTAPSFLPDIDLVYFNQDEAAGMEHSHQIKIANICNDFTWEVTNQAHVHLWFEECFGQPVQPLKSIEEAVATWPEFATSVGITLTQTGDLEIIAPFGLDDLFEMRVRHNPTRASIAAFRSRIASKRYKERWPNVLIMEN